MQAGLKAAPFSNIVTVVVDLQAMPAHGKDDFVTMFKGLTAYDAIKANVANVQTVVVKVNEPGKLKLSVALLCSDKASAGDLKDVTTKTLAEIKLKTKESKILANAEEQLKKMEELLKKVKKADEKTTKELEKAIGPLREMFNSARAMLNSIQVSAKGNEVTVSAEVEPAAAMETMSGWALMLGEIAAPPAKDPKSSPPPGK